MKVDMSVMKSNILKNWLGYLFFTVLAGACVAAGAIAIPQYTASGIFAIVLGLVVIAVAVVMAMRKN
jgi:hypothetical protein